MNVPVFRSRSVKIILLATLGLLAVTPSKAQTSTALSKNVQRYLGHYVFSYPRNPPRFEKIRWIVLDELTGDDLVKTKPDAESARVGGYLETIDDEKFLFKKATLKKNAAGDFEEITVETEKLNGVHYTFKGSFLDRPILSIGGYSVLTGSLIKYKDGEVVAMTNLKPFTKYADH